MRAHGAKRDLRRWQPAPVRRDGSSRRRHLDALTRQMKSRNAARPHRSTEGRARSACRKAAAIRRVRSEARRRQRTARVRRRRLEHVAHVDLAVARMRIAVPLTARNEIRNRLAPAPLREVDALRLRRALIGIDVAVTATYRRVPFARRGHLPARARCPTLAANRGRKRTIRPCRALVRPATRRRVRWLAAASAEQQHTDDQRYRRASGSSPRDTQGFA